MPTEPASPPKATLQLKVNLKIHPALPVEMLVARVDLHELKRAARQLEQFEIAREGKSR